MLQDGVGWFHRSENSVWRNDGENVGQTSRKVAFVRLHVVLFRSFYCYFNFWCMFSLRLLSYGDGNPSKPHLNLRGKHFLFFCICRCLWENCVPKIELTRAILRSLGDCFGTPLLRRSFLILFITTIYRSFKDGIEARHSYRVSAVIFKPYISIENGWDNYIRTLRRGRVGTSCVMFQSADLFVLRTVSLKYYIS